MNLRVPETSPLHAAMTAEDSQLAVAQKLHDMGMDPDLEAMNMSVNADGKVVRNV